MTTSVSRARLWSMTIAGFGADVYLFLIVGLVLWLLLPTLVLGWSPVMIASGSMSPAVRPGDIVLINEQVADEPLGAGTIITYIDPRQDRDGLVTHRIAETALTPEADAVAEYVTRGDANTVNDAHPVPHDQIVGSARLLIPLLGLPVHWARSADHTNLSIFVLVTMTAITVASGTARQTAVSVRPSRQQLRRNSRFAQRERAVIAARAARAAEAAKAAASVPDGAPPRFTVPVERLRTSSPATSAAPPVQRGVGAAPGAGRGAGGGPTAATDLRTDEPRKPRLTPVAGLRRPAERTTRRRPSRMLMLLCLIALTTGGAAIPGTGAALTAAGANTGNMFSTAAPDPEDDPEPFGDLILSSEAGGGLGDTVDDGDIPPGQYQTYTFVFDGAGSGDVDLLGEAVARLSLRRNGPGNSPGDAVVRLLADGDQVAVGSSGNVTSADFATVVFTLDGALDGTYDPSSLTVEVDLRRLSMNLEDGASLVELPHAG